ncbi:ribosome maturation factor RimM [Herbivorax alkaliphila]
MEIGKIINTRGIRGELKIIPLTDNPKRFDKLQWVYISSNISENMEKYYIEHVKYHKNFVYLKFKEIDNLNDAEKFKDLYIIIDRKDSVNLPEGSYFMCDLIGMNVIDQSEKVLGKLKDVLKTGSNDVYIVKDEDENEILIPALKSVVKNISIEKNKIVVSLPQGLIEDEI